MLAGALPAYDSPAAPVVTVAALVTSAPAPHPSSEMAVFGLIVAG